MLKRIPAGPDRSTSAPSSGKPPLRTKVFVRLSILAVIGVKIVVGGANLAGLIVDGLPADP